MRFFWQHTKEQIVDEEINNIVSRLTSGDYTDSEISRIIMSIKSRSLVYLKERRQSLSEELQSNIESIKKIRK